MLKNKLSDLTVEEYTTPAPLVLSPEDTVEKALTLCREEGIRHFPVLEGKKVVGIITERDLLAFYQKEEYYTRFKVKDALVSQDPFVVTESTTLEDVAIRCLLKSLVLPSF